MDVITFIFLSLLPGFEPRYSVVLALASGWGLLQAVFLAMLSAFLLSAIMANVLWFGDMVARQIPIISTFWAKYVDSARLRAKKYVDRYGTIGLTLFVAIPLPATGIWTGSIAAYFLGMGKREMIISTFIGGVISVLITILSYYGVHVIISAVI